MGWFRKNEVRLPINLNSEEYEKISKKIVEMVTELSELQNKFKILETNYDNLRGNFNRKLSGIKKEEVIEETEKDIKKSIFATPDGIAI